MTAHSAGPTDTPARAGGAAAPDRRRCTLADGRTLSYSSYGADHGPCVLVLDGPGSRGLALAAAPAAASMGVRLVAPDRPGFGETTVPEHGGIGGGAGGRGRAPAGARGGAA